MKTRLTLLSFLFLASACGGGSGDSGSTTSSNATTQTPVNDPPATISTRDLVVDSSFNYETNIDVQINVAANLVNARAFINVCGAPSSNQPLNYSDCYLRSTLSQDGLIGNINIPHKSQTLVAQIWSYDPETNPLTFTWQYDGSKTVQLFNIQ